VTSTKRKLGAGLLLVAAATALATASRWPAVSGFAFVALLLLGLVASEVAHVRQSVTNARRSARLTLAQVMSDGRPRTRQEAVLELRRLVRALRRPPLRWLRLEDDALTELTRSGLLEARAGRYAVRALPSAPPSDTPRSDARGLEES